MVQWWPELYPLCHSLPQALHGQLGYTHLFYSTPCLRASFFFPPWEMSVVMCELTCRVCECRLEHSVSKNPRMGSKNEMRGKISLYMVHCTIFACLFLFALPFFLQQCVQEFQSPLMSPEKKWNRREIDGRFRTGRSFVALSSSISWTRSTSLLTFCTSSVLLYWSLKYTT